ncbi:hypothetical protein J056_001486 [Wallemia ichthyophaga EXF-994]|uniref:Uncharacterized protein n=1 Tax=Wallemia ichthyophaga (strain EXF-994 / CBS 113033) TaxID=1299270 RepID=R9AC35_WALI9|nr:uncharacterized protein J056_001486 [Wallemia ichthyophaga EXF-994]EOQ99654.1 hypothetical protein J056_001486 [Wallemia ichthyophaga EXF-994]
MPDDYSFKPTKGLKFKNDSGLKRKKKSSAQTAPKDNAIGPTPKILAQNQKSSSITSSDSVCTTK